MSSFRSAVSVYNLVFCSYFTKRDSVTGVFLWILQNIANFFIEHLRTAASETVTENSLRNSARNGRLHIISPVDVSLGSKCASA